MYSLLSGLVKHLTRKDEFSVLLLGLDGAGKTNFLEAIKSLYNEGQGLPPENISSTIGQNIGKISLASTILQFWDVGGRKELRSIWNQYYADCHAVCFLVDSSDNMHMEECWKVFDSVVQNPRLKNIPILVVANKQDKNTAISVESIKEALRKRVHEGSDALYGVLPVSAIKREGCKECVEWLLVRVAVREQPEEDNGSS